MSAKNYINWIKKMTTLLGFVNTITLVILLAARQSNSNFNIFNKPLRNSARLAQLLAAPPQSSTRLRYFAINVGNIAGTCAPSEFTLFTGNVVERWRNYILSWKPDSMTVSKVRRASQLTGT